MPSPGLFIWGIKRGMDVCDVCKKESKREYGAIVGQRYLSGHETCVRAMQNVGPGYLKKFCWGDDKGSYSPGWLNDVKHRRVVKGGEVIRDYGRRYFT